MALEVGIINGKAPSGGSGGVSDADLLNIANNFLNKGIVGVNDFALTLTSGLGISIAVGNIYVPNADGSILYPLKLTSAHTDTAPSNSTGNDRISTLAIKLDLGASPDSLADNVASFVWVNGSSSATPIAPTDAAIQSAVGSSNGFIRLFDIYVSNGASSLSSGDITDRRAGANFKVVFPNYIVDVYGSTITFDISVSKTHLVTLTGSPIFAIANCPVGQSFVIRFTEDSSGGRTPTWFSTINWGNQNPTTSFAANKSYAYAFLCTAENVYDGYIINENI